jgi:hypothetical protein
VTEDQSVESEEPSEEEFATPIPPRRTGATAAPMLAGMMLAVGEIIEPEKTKVEIAVEHSTDSDEDPFDLDFGNLPPLD